MNFLNTYFLGSCVVLEKKYYDIRRLLLYCAIKIYNFFCENQTVWYNLNIPYSQYNRNYINYSGVSIVKSLINT